MSENILEEFMMKAPAQFTDAIKNIANLEYDSSVICKNCECNLVIVHVKQVHAFKCLLKIVFKELVRRMEHITPPGDHYTKSDMFVHGQMERVEKARLHSEDLLEVIECLLTTPAETA